MVTTTDGTYSLTGDEGHAVDDFAEGRYDRGRDEALDPPVLSAAARKFRNGLLVQVSLAALPAAAGLAAGNAFVAGMYFWSVLVLLIVRLVVLRRRRQMLCLLVALAPMINLLREVSFYNTVSVLFGSCLLIAAAGDPRSITTIFRRSKVVPGLILFVVVYYIVGFILTGLYMTNLRMFEFVFSALAVVLIGRNKDMLGFALLGLFISAVALGVAMLPHIASIADQRLGMIKIGQYTMGDPGQLGSQMAILLFCLMVDNGRWMGLEHRRLLRGIMMVMVIVLLALSTSRTSWLIAATGLLIMFLFHSGNRRKVLLYVGLGVVGLVILSLTPLQEGFQRGIDRTFGNDRNLSRVTDGRSDMWIVGYRALTQTAGSLLYGTGPGSGSQTYSRISLLDPSVQHAVGGMPALHSLYVQIAVEAGLLGLLPFLLGLATVLRRTIQAARTQGDFLPLLSGIGYAIIIGAASGTDTVPGVFFGIALLTCMGSSYVLANDIHHHSP